MGVKSLTNESCVGEQGAIVPWVSSGPDSPTSWETETMVQHMTAAKGTGN